MSDFYEDVAIGSEAFLGGFLFTREAILAFATQFDPQPFHLDDDAAAAGPFGRLAASGWHTAAIWMKLYVAHRARERAAMAARGEPLATPGPSPGFRNLRWLKPVYAGDTIDFAVAITDKRVTARPGWGIVFRRGSGTNQHGEPVYRFDGSALWQRRSSPPDQA